MKLLESRRNRQALQRLATVAADWPTDRLVAADLIVPTPSFGAFCVGGNVRLVLGLRFINTSTFGLCPNFLLKLDGEVCSGGEVVARFALSPRPMESGFLNPGERLVEQVDITVLWTSATRAITGQSIHVAVRGDLRLLGPWSTEYKGIPFTSSTYGCVHSVS